jgi:TonB-dependent starch-binding outer membrane protein SusC
VPAGAREVRVQLIGYGTQTQAVTVAAGETAAVEIALAQTAVALDEVVVTGTAGRQERRAQAAVVATVPAATIVETSPISTVSDILQARTPGVSMIQMSGTSGTAQHIRIRGAASLTLSNEPLIFIDGVRMDSRIQETFWVGGQLSSRLNDIRPEDIESIEVVKGPAAATLYGADASAGVIQIIRFYGFLGGGMLGSPLTVGMPQDGWFAANRQVDALTNIDSNDGTLRTTPTLTVAYNPTNWFTNRLNVGADLSRTESRQFFPLNQLGWYATALNVGQMT